MERARRLRARLQWSCHFEFPRSGGLTQHGERVDGTSRARGAVWSLPRATGEHGAVDGARAVVYDNIIIITIITTTPHKPPLRFFRLQNTSTKDDFDVLSD